MVYTCVSQGPSQRWRIENEEGSRVDHLYTSGDTLGVIVQGVFTFTLYSASLSDFISAVSVTASVSLHNTRLECTGHSSRASKAIYIAGMCRLAMLLYGPNLSFLNVYIILICSSP